MHLTRRTALVSWLVPAMMLLASLGVGFLFGEQVLTGRAVIVLLAIAFSIAVPEAVWGMFAAGMLVWAFPLFSSGQLQGSYSLIVLFLATLGASVRAAVRGKLALPRLDRTDLLFLLMWGYLILAQAWSASSFYASWKVQAFGLFSVVPYLVIRNVYRSQPEKLGSILACAAVMSLASVWSAAQAAGAAGTPLPNVDWRAAQDYLITNDISTYGVSDTLAIGQICAVATFLSLRSRSRWAMGVIAILAFAAQIIVGKRIQLIGAVLACTYLFGQARSGVRIASSALFRSAIAVAVLLAALTLIFALNPHYRPEFIASDPSYYGRFEVWGDALRLSLVRPIVGLGTGAFPRYARWNEAGIGADVRLFPHNVLLEVLVEGGIVGLALFVILLVELLGGSVAHMRRRATEHSGYLVHAAFVLVAFRVFIALFSADLGSWQVGIWAGMLLAAIEMTRNKEKSELSRKLDFERAF